MSGWQPGGTSGNPYDPYGGPGGHHGGGYQGNYQGGYQGYEPGAPLPGPPPPGTGGTTDGISIASFVCSVLCCTAPVGVGLGIAGLVRTKGGRRRGRWAAIWGTMLGVVGTIGMLVAFAGLVWLGLTTVPEDEAEVGQCVNTSSFFDSNDLWTAECDEEHDAEIVAAGELDDELVAVRRGDSVDGFCRGLAGEAYASVLADPDFELDWSTDAVDDEIEVGDHFACYVQRVDGDKLDAPLTDDGGATGIRNA